MLEKRQFKRMKKISFVSFCVLFFYCFVSGAKEVNIPVQEVQSLLIKALHLKLTVKKSHSQQYQVSWTGPLSVKNDKGVLTIQDDKFHLKNSWRASSRKPLIKLEIAGPAVPLKIFAFDASASFSYWRDSVFISSFRGTLKGSHNKGFWQIHFKEGVLDLSQQKGSLFVRGFRVKSDLKSSQGDFRFFINEGFLNVNGFKGYLRFITDKAKANLKHLKGSLKGSSQSGDLSVSIKPEKVDLAAEEASVRLYFMGQAPKIKAYTEKGKVYGSNYLYKQFSGKSTTVSGRIRGASKKGEVLVQSHTGNIYIN